MEVFTLPPNKRPARFANNPAHVRYESLLIDLAAAMAAGDEDRANGLRDEMEGSETHLNSAEILRLNGLSGDLSSLYDQELPERFDGTHAEYDAAFHAAGRRNDEFTVLKMLRYEQDQFSRGEVAFFRYCMYQALGHDAPAQLFLASAMRLDPNLSRFLT